MRGEQLAWGGHFSRREAAGTQCGPSWPSLDRLSPLVGQVLHKPAAHHLDRSIAWVHPVPTLSSHPWEAGCEGPEAQVEAQVSLWLLLAPQVPTNRPPLEGAPGLSIVQSHTACWGHVGSTRGPS